MGKLGLHIDVLNTHLPDAGTQAGQALRELANIPRMFTIAIGALINKAVAEMSEQHAYLDIGVWNGFTFLSGMVNNPTKTCIGVDNFCTLGGPRDAFIARFEKFKSPRHRFHDMDYRDYFAQSHKEQLGFMFTTAHIPMKISSKP